MEQYTAPEAYTQETTRLDYTGLDYTVQPIALAPQPALMPYILFASAVLIMLLVLARMPAPAPQPVYPAVDNHVEILSHNCIGWCP